MPQASSFVKKLAVCTNSLDGIQIPENESCKWLRVAIQRHFRSFDMSTNLQTKIASKTLEQGLALGLWDFNDKSSAFVVFDDDDGQRKAFLLGGWRGRPGYTRMPLSEVEDCKFVAEVAVTPTEYASFTAVSAMLGKLVVRDGRALITTVDDKGKMAFAPVAPLADPTAEDEECSYSWMLVDWAGGDAEYPGLFHAHGHNSWLNFWISPDYERDEFGCPCCGQDFPPADEPEQ
jgi:hypothetical protein